MLIPHIPVHIPLIILTSHTSYHTMKMASARCNTILLPAPIPELEEATFGVPAPTTSTTVAMALSDALALTVARAMHSKQVGGPREVFKRNHPGGAIGLNIGKVSLKISDLAVPLSDIPLITEEDDSRPCTPPSDSDDDGTMWSDVAHQVRVLDCLLLAVRSPRGWLRTSRNEVIPPRALQRVRDPNMGLRDADLDILVPAQNWLRVPGDASIEQARKWVLASSAELTSESDLDSIRAPSVTIVGVVVQGKVVGVMEVEDLLNGCSKR